VGCRWKSSYLTHILRHHLYYYIRTIPALLDYNENVVCFHVAVLDRATYTISEFQPSRALVNSRVVYTQLIVCHHLELESAR